MHERVFFYCCLDCLPWIVKTSQSTVKSTKARILHPERGIAEVIGEFVITTNKVKRKRQTRNSLWPRVCFLGLMSLTALLTRINLLYLRHSTLSVCLSLLFSLDIFYLLSNTSEILLLLQWNPLVSAWIGHTYTQLSLLSFLRWASPLDLFRGPNRWPSNGRYLVIISY